MAKAPWKKNKKYYLFIIVLLLFNCYFFYHFYLAKPPDLAVKEVTYLRERKELKIEVESTHTFKQREVPVKVVFRDGEVKEKFWSLAQRKETWELKAEVPVDGVFIQAPAEIDWDAANSKYLAKNWSKPVRLKTMSSSEDLDFAVDWNKNLFIIYTKNSLEDDSVSVFIEKRNAAGKLLLGPELVFSQKDVKVENPFLYLFNENDGSVSLIAGWNVLSAAAEPDRLYFLSCDSQIKIEKNIIPGQKVSKKLRILDKFREPGSKNWYLLVNSEEREDQGLRIYHLIKSEPVKKISVPLARDFNQQIKYARIIPDNEGFNIFLVKKDVWSSKLYFQKIDTRGRVVLPLKELAEFRIDTSIPDPIQIIKDNYARFHIVLVQVVGTVAAKEQRLKYLVIDSLGEIINQWDEFINNHGYIPGFALTSTPTGDIELYLPRLHEKRNTELYYTKFTSDFVPLLPLNLVAGSSYYEKYPRINWNTDGYRYLHWFRDSHDREAYYITDDPEAKTLIDKNNGNWKERLFKNVMTVSVTVSIGLLFILFGNFMPLIGLIFFHQLGGYRDKYYHYWLTVVLFLFSLKILNEVLYFSWNDPVLSRAYSYHLLFLGLIVLLISIYWYYCHVKKKKRRFAFLNWLLVGWLSVDTFFLGLAKLLSFLDWIG